MHPILQSLWNFFRRMLNRLQRTENSVQYFLIFNHDVYFNHDESVHHLHNGDVLNRDRDYSFHSSNNGNWMSNTVTNWSNENASTIITNGNAAGGVEVPGSDNESEVSSANSESLRSSE
ncbi:hypothetical protein CPC08DRAFT_761388 [Agrocybe pediades]|nr:hypothetical protein CPC08DRAFT_761388 [Agrocybe pediades]